MEAPSQDRGGGQQGLSQRGVVGGGAHQPPSSSSPPHIHAHTRTKVAPTPPTPPRTPYFLPTGTTHVHAHADMHACMHIMGLPATQAPQTRVSHGPPPCLPITHAHVCHACKPLKSLNPKPHNPKYALPAPPPPPASSLAWTSALDTYLLSESDFRRKLLLQVQKMSDGNRQLGGGLGSAAMVQVRENGGVRGEGVPGEGGGGGTGREGAGEGGYR